MSHNKLPGCSAVHTAALAITQTIVSDTMPDIVPEVRRAALAAVPPAAAAGGAMHPHMKSLLVKAGCAPDASDDEARKFHDGLSDQKKKSIETQLAALMDGEDDTDGEGDEAAMAAAAAPAAGAGANLSVQQVTQIATQAAMAAVRTISTPATPAAGGSAAVSTDEGLVIQERRRVAHLRALGEIHRIPADVLDAQVASGADVRTARLAFLKHVEKTAKALPSVRVGDDANVGSLVKALPQAIVMRAGLSVATFEAHKEVLHPRAIELKGMRLTQMYRTYLAALGCQEAMTISDVGIVDLMGRRALTARFPRMAMLAEGTSDFANITMDAINKSLRFNYLDAKRTWPIWAEKRFNPDFKNIHRVVLSEAPNMVSTAEGGEINYVTLGDSGEVYALTIYKGGIKLTRMAMINDDLDAFVAIPRLQANSAARKEDDVAYAAHIANPTMADGNAVFSAAHSNYVAVGAGGLPSILTLQAAATAIKKQKGPANAARLELEGKFLLVPTSIEEQTKEMIGSKQLIASQSSNAAVQQTVGDNNPFFNRYTVIGSTRMDDASPTRWELWADFRDGQVSTAEVCFLTDEPEPVLKQETDFDTDDVKYLVRHTVAAKVTDYRGVYANEGH